LAAKGFYQVNSRRQGPALQDRGNASLFHFPVKEQFSPGTENLQIIDFSSPGNSDGCQPVAGIGKYADIFMNITDDG
jgi:hypothetical protein